MINSSNFIPTPNTEPEAFSEYYLKVEDTKGKILLLQPYDSNKHLIKEYEKINYSKQYSLIAHSIFPMFDDTKLSSFFQSLFIPNTLSICPPMKNYGDKIIVGLFTLSFDLISLPLRLITALPYTFYQRNSNTNHEILIQIQDNPEAKDALSEGKVIIKRVREIFSHIQKGSIDNETYYQIRGYISERQSLIYIKPKFYQENLKLWSFKHVEYHDFLMDVATKEKKILPYLF